VSDINKKTAEILVECEYAVKIFTYENEVFPNTVIIHDADWPNASHERSQRVELFSDTLEGRRQADAIEDWLYGKYFDLWDDSRMECIEDPGKRHQWRLGCIKWCLEELSK
jgi:hypothetical protein